MELICPQCGRDRLWYDPYTGNFDCPDLRDFRPAGGTDLPGSAAKPARSGLRTESSAAALRRSPVRPLPGGNGPGLLL